MGAVYVIQGIQKTAMILTITDVDYLGDYTLLCTFNDGVKKKVDLTSLLKYPAFSELKDQLEKRRQLSYL